MKHRVEENSIKMHDKQGSMLRVDTTRNNRSRFRVHHGVQRKAESSERLSQVLAGGSSNYAEGASRCEAFTPHCG